MLSTELDLTSAISRSLHAQDVGDRDRLSQQLAEDVVLCLGQTGGDTEELKGREAVLARLMESRSDVSGHIQFMGNGAIDMDGESAAHVSYMVLCPQTGGDGGQPSIRHCRDQLAKISNRWILRRREIQALDDGQ